MRGKLLRLASGLWALALVGCLPATGGGGPAAGSPSASVSTPTATSTTTSSATGTTTALVTIDSTLTLGSAATATDEAVAEIFNAGDPSQQLWILFANPWGVTTATGHTTMTYNHNGEVVTNVSYTSLNSSGVNGYPAIGYGADSYGYHNGSQAPQFPAQLSSMSSLILDTVHSLSITTAPGDLDVAYDEWLLPNPTYSSGPSGAVEVMVMYYYDFSWASSCSFVRMFPEAITLNGVTSTMNFSEYSCRTGPGAYVAFLPATNITSGEIRLDLLDFLNEGASTAQVGNDWYLAGIQLGTEFGHAGAVNYSLTVSKMDIEQTLK